MREPSEILTPSIRSRYLADAFDPDAIHSSRQSTRHRRLHCEQQLEIFAAVKRELKRIERATTAQFRYSFVDRQQRRVDQRAHIARRTQSIEIRRKTVTQIDHRSRKTFLAQHDSPSDARFRTKLPQQDVIEFLRVVVAEVLFGEVSATLDESQPAAAAPSEPVTKI